MTYHRFACAAMVVLGSATTVVIAAEWVIPSHAPLLTPWARDVSPTNALPEYPRPQMVRQKWQNLNGLWQYAVTGKTEEKAPAKYDGAILVPFVIESALSGVMKPLKPDQRLWYRRTFSVPTDWSGQRILLHFGAVDWETTVFVNGKNLGSHRGGYDPFSFDITSALKKDGPQEIIVTVWDPTDAGWQLRGKQTLHPGGSAYTACSGIWQTVWLEPVPLSSIESLHLVPDLAGGTLKVAVNARTPVGTTCVRVTVSEGGHVISSAAGTLGSELTKGVLDNLAWYKARLIWVTTDMAVPMKNAKPWSPDAPLLYDLVVQLLGEDGGVLDSVTSYVGMRSIAVGKDEHGIPRPFLNDKPIMLPGALDQAYWPDGLYTAPTDAALRFDIEAARRLGLTAIRKHLKIEPERYYYWADRLGLLILQDFPSGRDGDPYTDLPTSPEASTVCEMERRLLIQSRWNHPSIIAWAMFNEGWGQHDTLRHARWAKELDPTRLIDEASGFPRHGGGDIHDTHGGDAPQDGRRISLDSETAGFGLTAVGHRWPGKPWATGTYDPKTDGEGTSKDLYPVDDASRRWYTRRMCNFYREMWKKRTTTGTSGDFKVQLYDVETESNGFISYDRAVWKVDPALVARAARGEDESGKESAPSPSFLYENPIDFSYPYFDGKAEKTIAELRDPAIIREGDLYYLTFTAFPFAHSDSRSADKPDYNSSPGIMLYSSADLKSWKFEGWLVKSSDLPEDCPYKHRFWAPEIHRIRDKFYLIFTADNWIKDEYNKGGKIGAYVAFVGVADKVTGPYRHITWLKGAGCDTTLFADDDGKTYAIMPFGDEFIQEVDLRGIEQGEIKLIGPRKMIVARSNSDVGKTTSPDYLEGPWMIKQKGKYILFTAAPYRKPKASAQTTAPADLAEGYWVGAAVADNIWGPYRKQPQVFLGGHIAVFQSPDGKEWFSYRGEAGGKSQGRLCLDPIQFTEDGLIAPFPPSTKRVVVEKHSAH